VAKEHKFAAVISASEPQSCSLVKIRRLYTTLPEFGAPIGGGLVGISQSFWHQKTRVPGLSYGVVNVILGLAIVVQLRLVTD